MSALALPFTFAPARRTIALLAAVGVAAPTLAFVASSTSISSLISPSISPSDLMAASGAAQLDEATLSTDSIRPIFEANAGQFDPAVDFVVRGADAAVFIADGAMTYDVSDGERSHAVQIGLAGADPDVIPVATGEPGPTTSYFLGADASNWVTGVATTSAIEYESLIDGVGIRYLGTDAGLQYDLILDAGVDPASAVLDIDGADGISVDSFGQLIVDVSVGEPLEFSAPITYQDTAGGRVVIDSSYRLISDDRVGFRVGSHDPTLPLVIDPTLDLGTYVGTTGDDQFVDVLIDGSNNIIVVGGTTSSTYPTTVGAYDQTQNGSSDIVVTKMNAAGTALLWSSFIGGTGDDFGTALEVASDGDLVIAGNSASANFPTTAGAYDQTYAGSDDAVVLELSANGTALNASTFLGGPDSDIPRAIDVAADGTIVVAGSVASPTGFPSTAGAFDTTKSGTNATTDGFVTKLSATLAALSFSTFLGDTGDDFVSSLDVTPSGTIYVSGSTNSAAMPTTVGAYDTTHNGSGDVWVGRLSSSGAALEYATFLGGSGDDAGPAAIKVRADGLVYVASSARSGFPTTANAARPTTAVADNALVVVDPASTGAAQLVYGSFLGGTSGGVVHGVTIDDVGRAYMVGRANAAGLATSGAPDTTFDGSSDGILAVLNPTSGALEFLTYIGGTGADTAIGVVLDSARRPVVVGRTNSSNLATTTGAYDTTANGLNDGFVHRYTAPPPPLSTSTVVLDDIQTGTVTLADGATSITATIAAVDPTKSFLTYSLRGSSSIPSNVQVRGELTNATTLTFRRHGTTGDITIAWAVAEFSSGVTVQRGTTTLSSPTVDVAISAVDRTRSFPLVGMSVNGSTFGDNDFVRAELTSATNLHLAVRGATNLNLVNWQVVTYNDAAVQSGTVGFASGATTASATVTAVVPAKAWLLYSLETDNGTGNDIGQKLVRGQISDATTLTFDRSSSGQAMTLQWHLVEFTDATEVQHASAAFAAPDTIHNVTIDEVDRGRSIAVGGYLEYGGRSPYSADGDPGVAWFTTELTSNSNLRVQRAAAFATADLGWSVVHWPCADSDGDGLWDCREDWNRDGDNNPATDPGPDTDGDALANYLDADDDGDGTPTTAENADPNGDGDPRDARDVDRDGQPNYLDVEAGPSTTPIAAEQKISATGGGLIGPIDDFDNLGQDVTGIGDLDGDGIDDLAVGVPEDDDGGTSRGAVYVLFMNADGTVRAEQKISDTAGGFTGVLDDFDEFGHGLATIGDIDGDGVTDIAVGTWSDGDGGPSRGAVWILFLDRDGTVKAHQKISDTAGGLVAVLDDGDRFGSSLTGLGDLDGDGTPDLVVGARWDDDGGIDRGAVYVLFLNAGGTVRAEQKISDTAGGLVGSVGDLDEFGHAVAGIGDLDGDGIGDLAVGAPLDDGGGTSRGAVHVLFLNADGTVRAEQKLSSTAGPLAAALDDHDWFGSALAGIGDLDGNGTPDLAVGARGDGDGAWNAGAVYLLRLAVDGTIVGVDKISATTGGLAGPLDVHDHFGRGISSLGDLDSDGALNLVVTARYDDDGGPDRGAVYVLDLSIDHCISDSDGDGLWDCQEDANSDADNDPATSPGRNADGDAFANYLDADDDGDGTPTAAENADPNGDGDPRDAVDSDRDGQPDYLDRRTGPGLGRVAAEQKISDTQGGLMAVLDDGDQFGTDVASIGDIDGDGIVDLVVGAYGDSDGGPSRGAVYILFLNANGTVRAEQKISDTQGGLTAPLDDYDNLGVAVGGIGDLDGDGISDMAVGAWGDDDGGPGTGAVYILFLNANGTVKAEQKLSDTQGGLAALLDDFDNFGVAVSGIGDVDDDGIPDIAVGAWGDDDGGTERGAVHIVFLNANGTVRAEQKLSDTQGGFAAPLDNSDLFGGSVGGIGDVDGDGTPDISIGAFGDDDGGTDRGAVHIVFLNANGTRKAEQKISDTQGGFAAPLDDFDYFGVAAGGVGDVDGDGIPDIAVAAPQDADGGLEHGAIYILFLNANGSVRAEQKVSDTQGGFASPLEESDFFGTAVGGIGDLDGDGTVGLAVSAYGDDDGGNSRGAVYILDLEAGAFVVNSTLDTDDTNPGDGVCGTGALNTEGNQACTLRAALTEANAAPNANRIEFDIPSTEPGYTSGTGVWTIAMPTSLLSITAPVEIVGATQTTNRGDTNPGIRGATRAVGTGADGVVGTGDELMVDGVPAPEVELDFDGQGFRIESNAVRISGLAVFGGNSDFWIASGTGAVISDNLIGSRASSFSDPGPALRSNGAAGVVVAGSSGASVVDNVIGFQNQRGVGIVGVNANVTVSGNEIVSTGLAGGVEGGGIEIPSRWSAGSDLDGAVITGNLITGTIADLGIEVATGTLDTGIVIENNAVLGNGVLVYGFQNADGGTLRHNEIRNSNTEGILIAEVVGWSILGNSITNSAQRGIDLMTGGNGELAAPTIDAVATDYGVIEFDVTVKRAAGNYRIEFFSNPSPGPYGFGEGERFLGSSTIAHPGGIAAYTLTVPRAPGTYVAATLTVDEGAGEFGSTSEFSNSQALTCSDNDGDGLCNEHEDANSDLDDDPATSPGPDSDGDALPDYLDADDDSDGTPTTAESADPNGDGNPRDAVDTDRDGEPDYLDLPTGPTTGRVADEQKISDLAGGLTAVFDDSDYFGRSVASIGDVDNDGTVDVAVGAYGDDDGGPDRGALHIVFLNPDGTVKDEQKISSTIGGFTGPLGNFDYFGWSAAGIGDLDGDGTVDLAVGALFDDDGGGVRGAVHIVFLNPDGTVKDDQKISDTQGGLVGALDNTDNFGGTVAGIGDLDGDGIGDLAVGASGDDDGGTNRGATYILFLNPDGTVRAEQKISHTQGGFAGALDDGDNFGGSVAGVGDLDGDGVVDLVVGATADDDGGGDRGAVYVLFLNADGTVKARQKISDLVGGLAATFDNSDQFGISVAGVGDLDGDGALDVVVGANLDDDGGLNRGAAHLLFLNTNGTVKAERKISSTTGGFTGPLDNSDLFAISLVGLGDLDDDGVTDLAVGASFDDDGGSNRGAIYVLSLESDPTVVVNSTGDAADLLPGDRRCDTGGTNSTGQPECTLRAAISHAIASSSQFAIQFAIPAADPGHTAGVWRITPSTALPTITTAMSIDARTQPGFASTPVVEIYGAGAVADGLLLGAASNSVMIRGLAMGGFTSNDIEVRGNGHLIAGNHFGVTADGSTPFPIGTAGTALRVEQGTGTTIGGASPGDGNVITNAGAAGITILGGNHMIRGNSIIGNAGIGIDVGGDGVTTPDPGDVDGVLNQPQLLGADESANASAVTAVFDAPVGNYLVEYFDNPGGTDPSGYGEGQKLIAMVPVSVTAPGQLVLRHVVPGTGLDLTATATSVTTSTTSEFSNAISSVASATAAVSDVSIRRSDLASVGGAPTTVSGPTGPAFDLDGVGDMYVGPALDVVDGALELRSSIRLDSMAGNPVVISKRATSGVVIYELGVDTATGRATAAVRLSGSLVTASGGALSTGSWHQLDAVWDGNELILYVDGIEVDRVAAVGTLATDVATRMIVGARDDGTRRLDGAIDNVHVGHDPSSAAVVAVRHTNRVGPSLLTVGAEQTNSAGSWTTASAQSRSGSSALSAPETAGSGSPAWAVATGIDEPGLVFESWWWISQSSDLDLASGTRSGSTPVDQYSSGSVDTPLRWELRQQRGDNTSVDGVAVATPPTGAWFEVEMWTDQSGDTRLLIDGAEVIGWTPQGNALTSGSAGLLVNRLPAGQSWYVDDARVRKLVMPEPVTSLGPLDRK